MSHRRAQQSRRRKQLERQRQRAWQRIMDLPSTRGDTSGPVLVNGEAWFDRQAPDDEAPEEAER